MQIHWKLLMRASEFILENADCGTTVSGSFAPVVQPMGEFITRQVRRNPAKYSNSAPVTKRIKKNARR